MLRYFLLLALIPLLLIPTFGQEYSDNVSTSLISIQTDNSHYNEGDTIVISGNVGIVIGYNPVLIHIIHEGIIIEIAQITVDQDGSFTKIILAEKPAWENEGEYIVKVYYQDQVVEIEFSYTLGNESLTITTNKLSYQTGDTIYVLGQITNPHSGTSVHISLGLPDGTTSPLTNVILSGPNQFNITLPTGTNATVSIPGSYSLTAYYNNSTAFTTFDYYDIIDNEEEELSLFTLSDHELSRWTKQLQKWENTQMKVDNYTEKLELKLDRAISKNNTNQIIVYTERINNSMALSELYDSLIDCLEEQLGLLS